MLQHLDFNTGEIKMSLTSPVSLLKFPPNFHVAARASVPNKSDGTAVRSSCRPPVPIYITKDPYFTQPTCRSKEKGIKFFSHLKVPLTISVVSSLPTTTGPPPTTNITFHTNYHPGKLPNFPKQGMFSPKQPDPILVQDPLETPPNHWTNCLKVSVRESDAPTQQLIKGVVVDVEGGKTKVMEVTDRNGLAKSRENPLPKIRGNNLGEAGNISPGFNRVTYTFSRPEIGMYRPLKEPDGPVKGGSCPTLLSDEPLDVF